MDALGDGLDLSEAGQFLALALLFGQQTGQVFEKGGGVGFLHACVFPRETGAGGAGHEITQAEAGRQTRRGCSGNGRTLWVQSSHGRYA